MCTSNGDSPRRQLDAGASAQGGLMVTTPAYRRSLNETCTPNMKERATHRGLASEAQRSRALDDGVMSD